MSAFTPGSLEEYWGTLPKAELILALRSKQNAIEFGRRGVLLSAAKAAYLALLGYGADPVTAVMLDLKAAIDNSEGK